MHPPSPFWTKGPSFFPLAPSALARFCLYRRFHNAMFPSFLRRFEGRVTRYELLKSISSAPSPGRSLCYYCHKCAFNRTFVSVCVVRCGKPEPVREQKARFFFARVPSCARFYRIAANNTCFFTNWAENPNYFVMSTRLEVKATSSDKNS